MFGPNCHGRAARMLSSAIEGARGCDQCSGRTAMVAQRACSVRQLKAQEVAISVRAEAHQCARHVSKENSVAAFGPGRDESCRWPDVERCSLSSRRQGRSERIPSDAASLSVMVRHIPRSVRMATLVATSMLLGSSCYAQGESFDLAWSRFSVCAPSLVEYLVRSGTPLQGARL